MFISVLRTDEHVNIKVNFPDPDKNELLDPDPWMFKKESCHQQMNTVNIGAEKFVFF